MTIDQSQVKGEPGTGYEGPENGAFNCGNCTYFKGGTCGQETMMAKSKLPRTDNGRVRVDPLGCCEYVERRTDKAKRQFVGMTVKRRNGSDSNGRG